jgi:short-subunit dehydrogenase
MTMFATSVAAEVNSLGIDVVVVHPSPMATNFFEQAEGKWPKLLRHLLVFVLLCFCTFRGVHNKFIATVCSK